MRLEFGYFWEFQEGLVFRDFLDWCHDIFELETINSWHEEQNGS